jgi:hypothetical protein
MFSFLYNFACEITKTKIITQKTSIFFEIIK